MLKHQQTVLPASPADSSPMPRTAFQGSTQVSPGTAWLQLQVLFYTPELLSRSTYHHSMCASPHRAQGWLWKCVWRAFPEKMTAGQKSNPQHNFWQGRQFRKSVILLQVHSLGGFYFYSGFPTSPHPSLFLSFLGMTHPIFLWWLETLHREDISHILNNTYWIKDDGCEKLCYSVFYFSGKKRVWFGTGFQRLHSMALLKSRAVITSQWAVHGWATINSHLWSKQKKKGPQSPRCPQAPCLKTSTTSQSVKQGTKVQYMSIWGTGQTPALPRPFFLRLKWHWIVSMRVSGCMFALTAPVVIPRWIQMFFVSNVVVNRSWLGFRGSGSIILFLLHPSPTAAQRPVHLC